MLTILKNKQDILKMNIKTVNNSYNKKVIKSKFWKNNRKII